jgi:pilus assembly protein Flp/PilA
MAELILRLFRNDSGVTAIEYGLIAGLVSIVIITSCTLMYNDLALIFGAVSTQLLASAAAG